MSETPCRVVLVLYRARSVVLLARLHSLVTLSPSTDSCTLLESRRWSFDTSHQRLSHYGRLHPPRWMTRIGLHRNQARRSRAMMPFSVSRSASQRPGSHAILIAAAHVSCSPAPSTALLSSVTSVSGVHTWSPRLHATARLHRRPSPSAETHHTCSFCCRHAARDIMLSIEHGTFPCLRDRHDACAHARRRSRLSSARCMRKPRSLPRQVCQ